MEPWLQTVLAVIGGVLASSGFWAYIMNRQDKKDAKTKMILGLGHDRIINLCMQYIERGWITKDEYEDLKKYLYKPYQEMGGNGTVEKLMKAVDQLPVHRIDYLQQIQDIKRAEEEKTGEKTESEKPVGSWY